MKTVKAKFGHIEVDMPIETAKNVLNIQRILREQKIREQNCLHRPEDMTQKGPNLVCKCWKNFNHLTHGSRNSF